MGGKWITHESYQGQDRRVVNGFNKFVWTVMMAACGVVFLGFMAWMTFMNTKVEAMSSIDQRREGQVSMLLQGMKETENRFGAVTARLDRIEDKIDRLLEVRVSPKR